VNEQSQKFTVGGMIEVIKGAFKDEENTVIQEIKVISGSEKLI
jgi:transcription antitermination factor NusG